MHQPYYTDPVLKTASMPWIRLHATKAYFDMAYLIQRHPTIRATFNFTPSLLLQLREVGSGSVRDLFLDHAQRPAADLTAPERAFLLRHFFAANWGTMVLPFPRYHELLAKRGADVCGQDLDQLAKRFTTQEFLDLQVWHNLSWFGYGALARYPQLAALRAKDRGFTEEEKLEVLALQQQVVSDIIPMYRRLAESGQIELTTTPFYHPILPLLIDTDFARRPRPDALLPQRFQAPEDAEAQIRRAVSFHTEVFGQPPVGLWPSEGSVCPEIVPMLSRSGIRWFATDEGILARSVASWDRQAALYQPYWIGQPGEEIAVLFRDRELSDAFGFVYAKNTAEAAVEDVMRRIATIAQHTPGERPVIPIILDGENPWEHYSGGGEPFLSRLYTELAKGAPPSLVDARITTDTISQALGTVRPTTALAHLHSGSWINTDFAIWLGHPEDNRAWDMLGDTRARLLEVAKRLPPDQAGAAWEELYAAEGSDWCWWYGEDFDTDYKPEFDRLFRTHLRNVYTRAGLPVPEFLNEPLVRMREPDTVRQPVGLLSPILDGRVSNFFEWRPAGTIDPAPPLGAMWKSNRFFTYLGFGFSLDALFLRLDPDTTLVTEGSATRVEIRLSTTASTYNLAFTLARPGPTSFTLSRTSPGGPVTDLGQFNSIRHEKIIELAVRFKDLNLESCQEVRMSVVVMEDGLEVERYPRHHPVVLTVPDQDFEARMWRV
jgi:alpha-amylase/alpha-mannosidase (GH57 family)